MNEILVKSGVEIDLGKRGEHLARCIVFDISGWQKTYGDGSVHLLHQRNGDKAPYPCVVETDGPYVRWLLSETDVDVAGRGRAELQYFVDEARVKSETWNTRTNRSMNNEGPIPEEPAVSWLNTMLELGTQTQENAEIAEQSAEDAKQSASEAEASASEAQDAKSEAEYAAAEADQSRVAAERAKTDAQNAAERAANDAAEEVENNLRDLVANAESAEAGAKSAQAGAEAAKLDAENAKESAAASAQTAGKSESGAVAAAERAEAALDSVEVNEAALKQAVDSAEASAVNAAASASNAAQSETKAKNSSSAAASSAQAAATSASGASASENAAKAAQAAAEKARDEAGEIVGGDFVPASRTINGKALSEDIALEAADVGAPTVGEMNAAIAAIPAPDVSGQIAAHNAADSGAHADIRSAINSHATNNSNPHGVTAEQVGARPNTWTPTAADVGARPNTWTPSAADVGAVPTSRTVNGKALSSNISLTASDVGARASTWMPSASDVGASASGHKHAAGDITSGTLAVARGGTGVTANPSMLTNLGSTTAASVFAASPRPGVTGTLSVANGGTGQTSVDTTPTSGSAKMVTSGGVYTALSGKSATGHKHAAGDITSGTLPVARGGTGVTSMDALAKALNCGNVEVVSYIGTDYVGQGYPMSLTFSFAPKFAVMYSFEADRPLPNGGRPVKMITSGEFTNFMPQYFDIYSTEYQAHLGFFPYSSGTGSAFGKKSEDGKTIHWYWASTSSTQDSSYSKNVANYSGYIYVVVAFG